jgi:hypothetical protein
VAKVFFARWGNSSKSKRCNRFATFLQQTTQIHILNFKTQVFFRKPCYMAPIRSARSLVVTSARSSTRFDLCDKIFDQLYLQLAPPDHVVLLTRMLVAEFLYSLLDTASYGR